MRDHTQYETFVRFIEFGTCLVTRDVADESRESEDLYRYLVWLLQLTHLVEKFSDDTTVTVQYMAGGGVVFDLGGEDNNERWTFTVNNSLDQIDWSETQEWRRRSWVNCIERRREEVEELVRWDQFYEYEIEHLPFLKR